VKRDQYSTVLTGSFGVPREGRYISGRQQGIEIRRATAASPYMNEVGVHLSDSAIFARDAPPHAAWNASSVRSGLQLRL